MALYLVTGGCGFIGSHLCYALLDAGHRVRVLDNLSTGVLGNVPSDVEMVRGSVANPDLVHEVMTGATGCFHLAAIASVEQSTRDWFDTHQTNLSGTIAVLQAASRARPRPIPVVYASSAAVYGHNKQLPLVESARAMPRSPYGADKYSCELQGRVAFNIFGVSTAGLRFFNVYGPRQRPDSPYSGVISIFCDRILRKRPIVIFGDGVQTRDFIFVTDVTAALLASMQNVQGRCDVFNVCTGRATSILELGEVLGELCGYKADIVFKPPRPGEIIHSRGNPSRIKRELAFHPSISLHSGLRQTLEWIRSTN